LHVDEAELAGGFIEVDEAAANGVGFIALAEEQEQAVDVIAALIEREGAGVGDGGFEEEFF
jgi:hypothetical protein